MHTLTALALGVNGFLSSEAAIAPQLCGEVIAHYAAGRLDEAHKAYSALMALMVAVTTMPGASVRRVKAAMRLLGRGGTYPRGPYSPIERRRTDRAGQAAARRRRTPPPAGTGARLIPLRREAKDRRSN